jgi:hypothetical protein
MSDAQGRWKLTIDTPMGEKTGILELKVEGDRLSGSLSDGEHHAEISEGRIRGRELTWSAKIHKPMRLTFKFTAVIDNDRISGAARHMLGSATFTGVRA